MKAWQTHCNAARVKSVRMRKEEFSKGEIRSESKCESRPGSAAAMIKSERTTMAANS